MNRSVRRPLVLAFALSGAGWAAPRAATAPAPPASAPVADAAMHLTVFEDDYARIEETRLRGAPQRVTVQSKIGGVAPYEIIIGPPGRDAEQKRGASGQRAWSILSF